MLTDDLLSDGFSDEVFDSLEEYADNLDKLTKGVFGEKIIPIAKDSPALVPSRGAGRLHAAYGCRNDDWGAGGSHSSLSSHD